METGPPNLAPRVTTSEHGLYALLALVGTKRMDVEALRERTRLASSDFWAVMGWLQKEYLVDLVSSRDGSLLRESVELTERGEALLVSLLERTCELPEFR